jgi:hypothetical protein
MNRWSGNSCECRLDDSAYCPPAAEPAAEPHPKRWSLPSLFLKHQADRCHARSTLPARRVLFNILLGTGDISCGIVIDMGLLAALQTNKFGLFYWRILSDITALTATEACIPGGGYYGRDPQFSGLVFEKGVELARRPDQRFVDTL